MKPIIVYGADWCPDCHRSRALLDRVGIDYIYKDVDQVEPMQEMLKITNGNRTIPAIIIGDTILQEPSDAELKRVLEVEEEKTVAEDKIHDVVMVGAGPAALTAAIYTTREDIDTVMMERGVVGGLAAVTDKIDNYPGFPDGIEGLNLSDQLRKQAERFGAVIELGEVMGIKNEGKHKVLDTTDGELKAKTVLIATGSDYKKVGVPGEMEFYARGVHYCATCDGAFYRDKKLVVIGGGNSAVQESIFLTRYSSHIDLLVRSTIKASEVLQTELQKYVDEGKITVHLKTTPKEIVGEDNFVTQVIANKDGKEVTMEVDGVFVFVGLVPNSQFVKDTLELDSIGFIKTNANLETSMSGVFAAGDIRSGATMQIASAAGEGATAALKIREYLEGQKHPIPN
jgi:thioredoxin reductase (NADPH)